MKIKSYFKILIIFFFTVFFSAGVLLSVAGIPAYSVSEEEFQTEIYSPNTYMEYYPLSSPVDIASNDGYFAVCENRKILVYDKISDKWLGETGTEGFSWTEEDQDLKQIELIDGYLFLRDATFKLYIFDIEKKTFINTNLNCNYFTLNDRYIATGIEGNVAVYEYTLTDGVFATTNVNVGSGAISGTAAKAPVYITDTNDLYCFKTGSDEIIIQKYNRLGDTEFQPTQEKITVNNSIFGSIPSQSENLQNMYITAIGSKLIMTVYTTPSVIFSADTNEGFLRHQLETDSFAALNRPMGLCSDNGKLLIADNSANAVKEFTVDGYKYNDYAVATEVKYKTRINNRATDIDIVNGNVSLLETDRLLIIKEGKIVKEIDLNAILDFVPKNLALGEKYALVTDTYNIAFIDLKSGKLAIDKIYNNQTGNLSVDYSDGKFYILRQNFNPSIAVFDEKDLNKSPENITITENAKQLTVDIEGNIYIYTDNDVQQNIYVYDETGAHKNTLNLAVKAIKIQVDFSGNLYILTGDNKITILKSNGEQTAYSIQLNANLPSNSVCNSFAVGFDCEFIYFSFDGKGFITRYEGVLSSANKIKIPDNIKLTGKEATEELSLWTVEQGKKIYSFDLFKLGSEYLEYTGYEKAPEGIKYIKLGETEDFYLFLGEKTCFVRKNNSEAFTESPFTDPLFPFVYTATTVNAYYYPKLIYTPTLENDPTKWLDSPFFLEGSKRLESGVLLKTLKEIDFNGTTFYLAQYSKNDETVTCYIPKNFTSQTLMDELVKQDYVYKRLIVKGKYTSIYSEENTEAEIFRVSKSSMVKVYQSDKKGLSLIEFNDVENNRKIYGYVKSGLIEESGKNTLRNCLIFILLAMSLCATSVYFIYRFGDRITK